uniref:Propionyl-CoA carboxylase beta chain n=1 Tax=Arundo donax TaxID=35708 RepID=A0A0A9GLR0_ARUDO
MRSRGSSFPRAAFRLTASAPPPRSTWETRARRSERRLPTAAALRA